MGKNELKHFHIHVYQVAMKAETDIEAYEKENALQQALDMAKVGNLQPIFPECGMIALVVEETPVP